MYVYTMSRHIKRRRTKKRRRVGGDPRPLVLVRFAPMTLFYGQQGIPLIQDFLLFFRSTGTSNPRFKGVFKDTWLPTFGMRRDTYMIKMVDYAANSNFTGLVTYGRHWPSDHLMDLRMKIKTKTQTNKIIVRH